MPNPEEQTGSGLVVTGRKGRGKWKKGPGSSKACHFCYRKGHWKNDCKQWRQVAMSIGANNVGLCFKLDSFLIGTSEHIMILAKIRIQTVHH